MTRPARFVGANSKVKIQNSKKVAGCHAERQSKYGEWGYARDPARLLAYIFIALLSYFCVTHT
jgi:hypothetical protein